MLHFESFYEKRKKLRCNTIGKPRESLALLENILAIRKNINNTNGGWMRCLLEILEKSKNMLISNYSFFYVLCYLAPSKGFKSIDASNELKNTNLPTKLLKFSIITKPSFILGTSDMIFCSIIFTLTVDMPNTVSYPLQPTVYLSSKHDELQLWYPRDRRRSELTKILVITYFLLVHLRKTLYVRLKQKIITLSSSMLFGEVNVDNLWKSFNIE